MPNVADDAIVREIEHRGRVLLRCDVCEEAAVLYRVRAEDGEWIAEARAQDEGLRGWLEVHAGCGAGSPALSVVRIEDV